MAQMSSQVRNRHENGAYVVSSVQTHGVEVAQALSVLDAELPAESQLGAQDIGRFLDWLGSILGHTNQQLMTAEWAYVDEQADDPPLRVRRDVRVVDLRAKLVQLRQRLELVLGSAAQARYALAMPPPRQASKLHDYALTAIKLLRAQPERVDDGLGGTLDTVLVANTLEPICTELGQIVSALVLEKRELDAAMLERNRRVQEWEQRYQGVANALASAYQLAGRAQLAERVRPTRRRTSGEASAPSPQPQPQPAGQAQNEQAPEPGGQTPESGEQVPVQNDQLVLKSA